MATTHDLMGGKVHLYMREGSTLWQCSSYLAGRNHRTSTKTESLERAKAFAEDWYFNLRLQDRAGELRGGHSFQLAAGKFMREYEALTQGERHPRYVKGHDDRLRVHLIPFFGNKSVTDITPGTVQDYRIHRMTSKKHPKTGEPMRPARSTLHHEIVTLRHVLKTAQRHGWVKFIPDLSPPYKTSGKIAHRGWFSREEYKELYTETGARAKTPLKLRWKWESEQLHDYVLFMASTGLRPDEAARLEFRDVTIEKDEPTGKEILVIVVRGKRGVGYCKSMPNAVHPFTRLRDRPRPKFRGADDNGRKAVSAEEGEVPKITDRIFPKTHRELFNRVLQTTGLKTDREGLPRTAYSLRHTYICFRLLEGADIYQIAKNCRTSVEMIEKHYAVHLKNMIDAAAINVRKGANATPKNRPNGRIARPAANAKGPRIRRK